MKIDHYTHTEILCTDGLCNYVCLIVPTIRGIDPYSKADRIHAKSFQQSHSFRLSTGIVVEFSPFSLHLCDPANVCTFCKIIWRRWRRLRIATGLIAGETHCNKEYRESGKNADKSNCNLFHMPIESSDLLGNDLLI